MNNYVICMDASGDIAKDIAEEHGVVFVPMEYTVGEEVHIALGCEEDEVMKKFYDAQRQNIPTTTSQISPYNYQEAFRKYLENGQSVLYFCLSSGLSKTYESSMVAAQQLKEEFPDLEVRPIDTLSATGAIGLLVERAIENQEKGMSLEENYQAIQELIPRVHPYFLVQDLMYLMRGGRINVPSAYLGSMLNIRPILRIDNEGKLETIAKKRGNKGAVQCLLDYFEELYDAEIGTLVYLCDSDAPELSDLIEKNLKEKHPELTIRRTMLCPVIGAHTGPGMASVIFTGQMRKSD